MLSYEDETEEGEGDVYGFVNTDLPQPNGRIAEYFRREKVDYFVDEDGYVNVIGDVVLPPLAGGLEGIRFGVVTGSFFCSLQRLSSLEGSPREVGKDFICNDNRLTTLKGAPKKVGGTFWCEHNNLTSLEGAPQEVGGSFFCGDNSLTSLEGAPQKIGGSFACWENWLTTLKGSPQYIPNQFDCQNNMITSLEGGPVEVGGDFKCRSNKLRSLKGLPKVGGNISIDKDVYMTEASERSLFQFFETFIKEKLNNLD